jgi:ribosomal protein S18 acetylase RimI-like enzyme
MEGLYSWSYSRAREPPTLVRSRSLDDDMRGKPHTVLRATGSDVPTLAGVLARAFMDDPVASWSCRPDGLRAGVLERFNGARVRQLLAHDEVWSTPDLSCAALWAPPGRWKTTAREDLELARCLLHRRLIPRLPLVVGGLVGMERRHPREEPHWYLAVLGTDPSAQGQGLGSAVLAPVLERCDEDGVGAYLESSKERNIDFYARHGFRVTGEIRLPRGPTMWPMWRDPR